MLLNEEELHKIHIRKNENTEKISINIENKL